MYIMKRIFGIVFMSMGCGMLVVLIIPGWGFLLAALLVVIGFWMLYMC